MPLSDRYRESIERVVSAHDGDLVTPRMLDTYTHFGVGRHDGDLVTPRMLGLRRRLPTSLSVEVTSSDLDRVAYTHYGVGRHWIADTKINCFSAGRVDYYFTGRNPAQRVRTRWERLLGDEAVIETGLLAMDQQNDETP